MKRQRQSGNAIVFILLGIALFAGLAHTFMRGSQQGQGNLTSYQTKLAAQEILDYAQNIEKSIANLQNRGCSENQFSFANGMWQFENGSAVFAGGHNSNSVAECEMFNPSSGAKLTAMTAPTASVLLGQGNDKYRYTVIKARMPKVGDNSKEDVVLRLEYVNPAVCKIINDMLGVENPSGDAPNVTFSNSSTLYNGTFADTVTVTTSDNIIEKKTAFCAKSGTLYSFNAVLIQR